MEGMYETSSDMLGFLKAALGSASSPEKRDRILDCGVNVWSSVLRKETENKQFLSRQLDKILFAAVVIAVGFAGCGAVATPGSPVRVRLSERLGS